MPNDRLSDLLFHPRDLIHYGEPLRVATRDITTYPSETRPKVVRLAKEIRAANGGDSFSRLRAAAAAVEKIMPYDPDPSYQNRNLSPRNRTKADNYTRITGIIENAGYGVCRHQAPLLVQCLKDLGFPDTLQVLYDLYKINGTYDVSHTCAYVPSRGVFVNPGPVDSPLTVTYLKTIAKNAEYSGRHLTNFYYLNPQTKKWQYWFIAPQILLRQP